MRNNEFPAFLYVLEDPRDPGNIRYIGITCSLPGRMSAHLNRSKRDLVSTLYEWWRGLPDGPVMRILWQGPPHLAEEHERKVIHGYKKLGFDLLNVEDGGNKGKTLAASTRRRLSERMVGKKYGPRSMKWRKALSESWTPERKASHSRLMAEKMRGKYSESLRREKEVKNAPPQ